MCVTGTRYEHIENYVSRVALRERYGADFTIVLIKHILPVPRYASKLRLKTANALLRAYMQTTVSDTGWGSTADRGGEGSPTKALAALFTLMPALLLEKVMKSDVRDELDAFWPNCLEMHLANPRNSNWQAIADILNCLNVFCGELALESRSSTIKFTQVLEEHLSSLLGQIGGAIAAVRENLVQFLRLLVRVHYPHPEGSKTAMSFAASLVKQVFDLRPRVRPRNMMLPYVCRAHLDLLADCLHIGLRRASGLSGVWDVVHEHLSGPDPNNKSYALQVVTVFTEKYPKSPLPQHHMSALVSILEQGTALELAWVCRCLHTQSLAAAEVTAAMSDAASHLDRWRRTRKLLVAKLNDRMFVTSDFCEWSLLLLARLLETFPALVDDEVLALPSFQHGTAPTAGSQQLGMVLLRLQSPSAQQISYQLRWILQDLERLITAAATSANWYDLVESRLPNSCSYFSLALESYLIINGVPHFYLRITGHVSIFCCISW